MTGADLVTWRKKNNYSQKRLQIELGIKSGGTISSWENSNGNLSRILELALFALEEIPSTRKTAGKS